ncbi:MAG TPA: ComF family protein [bacterium]|nr:ComF family protein [bacterium]
MFKLFFHTIYCKTNNALCLFLNLFQDQKCYGCDKKEKLSKYGFCQNCEKEIIFYQNSDTLFYHVAAYEGPIKNAIHKFKYGKKKFYGKKLALFVYDNLKEKIPEFDLIIPVPLHWKKEFSRTFNQSAIISVYLGKLFGKDVLIDGVVKTKNTPSQVELSGSEREKNVLNTFKVRKTSSIKDKKILLVDDVFTTGATTNELKKILKKAGAKNVIVITIAKTIL